MEYIKKLGLTALGLFFILVGAMLYFSNYQLGTSVFLVLGVGLLFLNRDQGSAHLTSITLKEVLSWIGIIIAAVTLALLIKKDITDGGFFYKPAKPTIYTLLKDEIA